MADSEFKVPVHREGKFVGLKKHRLLDRGEGEQNHDVRFFEDEGVWRGQQQKRSKHSAGKQRQATIKVRDPD